MRIHNIDKWRLLPAGDVLPVYGFGVQAVTLEVNCPEPTRFNLVMGKGKASRSLFLGKVQGLQTLEFAVGTPDTECYAHVVPDGECWYFTNVPDPEVEPTSESFLVLSSGRERNPQLDAIMYAARRNAERFEQAVAATRQQVEIMRDLLQSKGIDPDTGEVIDDKQHTTEGTDTAL